MNDIEVRDEVVLGATARYGYSPSQVHLRFYVGRFAGPTKGDDEKRIRAWCHEQTVGAGPIEVYCVRDVVDRVMKAAAKKQYRDHAVLVTLKALSAAGVLDLKAAAIVTAASAATDDATDEAVPQ